MGGMLGTIAKVWVLQDEFKFYLEDAKSKLLLVPKKGNAKAEAAAHSLQVDIAAYSLSWSSGLSVGFHPVCNGGRQKGEYQPPCLKQCQAETGHGIGHRWI